MSARRTVLLRMCSMHEQLQGEPNPNCPACRGEVSENGG